MSGTNGAILETAGQYLGLEEWPGARHNPEILEMFDAVGHGWVKDDETPWCAAFVGAVLGGLGLPHTGKLNARSYLDWGVKVSQREAMAGDVCIFWRGHPSAATGHVAFLVRFEGDKVIVRGGNQGNRVSDAAYPIARLLGIRRADEALPVTGYPTISQGNAAPQSVVRILQADLAELRYFAGKNDGIFGRLTDAAVRAFQADHGLGADGVVGPKTWAALAEAEPKPERSVSEDDLRASGSRHINQADGLREDARKTRGGVLAGLGVGTPLVLIQQAEEVQAAAERATSLLGKMGGMADALWPLLLIAAVGGLIWWLANRQERRGDAVAAIRVDDARTGANLGR